MKFYIACSVLLVAANALSNDACLARDKTVREKIQNKLATMGVQCEEMCKRIGAYPDCQCAGFDGAPAQDFDYRACFSKWCQDPAFDRQCPNDDFVGCVKGVTAVAVLQWPALTKTFAKVLGVSDKTQKTSFVSINAHAFESANSTACEAMDRQSRALIQQKVALMGPVCEDLCKRMGFYPNCQCPGFEGQPATSFDTRACFTKWCQDPAFDRKCPNDDFVGCVEGVTAVSVLQWPTLLSRMTHHIKMVNAMLHMPVAPKTSLRKK